MKRSLTHVCGVIATVAAFGQVMAPIGCNTTPDLVPPDAQVPDVAKIDAACLLCGCDPQPVMKALDTQGNEVEGDWSCYGPDSGGDAAVFFPLGLDAGGDADAADAGIDAGDAAPDGGAQCRFTLTDFVGHTAVDGASIEILFHNDPFATPDFSGTTDVNGELSFPAPGTDLMGYRILPKADLVRPEKGLMGLVWLDNRSCKDGDTYGGQSITKQSYDLLSLSLLGESVVDPMKMTVVVGVRDCKFRDVSGGIVKIFDDTSGKQLVEERDAGHDDFRAAYFGTAQLPDPACRRTGAQQSLYAALNVPVDRPLTVQASGRMFESDSSPVVMMERKLPLVAGTIVIVRPYKLYKNY